MTQISQRPVCWPRREKASLVPSGDHVGWRSWEVSLVIWILLPPPAGMRKMSHDPLRSVAKAMVEPSGEIEGMTSWAGSSVRRVTTAPWMDLV